MFVVNFSDRVSLGLLAERPFTDRPDELEAAIANTPAAGKTSLYDAVAPERFFQPGWEAVPAVVAANRANVPGDSPTSAPILVVQGTADEVVPAARTTRFVDLQLCRQQYDSVDYDLVPGLGHPEALDDSGPLISRWLQARFTGTSGENSCALPGLGISTATRLGAGRGDGPVRCHVEVPPGSGEGGVHLSPATSRHGPAGPGGPSTRSGVPGGAVRRRGSGARRRPSPPRRRRYPPRTRAGRCRRPPTRSATSGR